MEGQRRLLERILDGAEDPTDLPFALLQDITDNFSKQRKIGEGGFGEVYKGVLGERMVAVKRIHINVHTVDDKLFRREATSLMKINHRNIVRFLGVCSQGYHKPIEQDGSGKYIWANVLDRLLCFEYITNGSLDKYITDELRGLEWEARYEIITGICKGLHYLHNDKNIIHMDLKPANILLHHQDNKYMVPKITDFGLARSNKNSHTVGQIYGTLEYLAPEYRGNSETTYACDIYSLGLIIIEVVTGCKDFPHKDKVLRRWRQRWSEPPTQLRYQQVTRCIYIAEWCRELKPEARPSISKIISFLNESENAHTPINPCFNEDSMLKIKPLEVLLPYEWKNEISCSVELTNDTPNCISFNIQSPTLKYIVEPVKGIVQPKSKYYVKIKVQPRDVLEPNRADKFVVRSMQLEASDGLNDEDNTEHISCAEANKLVDEVDLMVVYERRKPLENSRSTHDTKIPTEELPKDKNKNIVESVSSNGKNKLGSSENVEASSMDISQSVQGQCTKQKEQCNFHPLQSFSCHSPTNEKYLGKKSRSIDHASGAMGSLLDKLGKLITEDYCLETSIKSDIDSFSIQLKKIQIELPKIENVDGVEVLVDKVREMSYNLEDTVDSFLVRVEPDSSRSGFRELKGEGLKIWENGTMTKYHIREVIRDIKNQVQVVVHMKEEYGFNVDDVVTNSTSKDDIDNIRNLSIYEDNEELVGIETPRDELIRLFDEDDDVLKKNLKIVSIVGLGGLGKTTLAKAVYDEFREQYHTRAFVSVGRNPDVENVLKSVIYELEIACNAEKMSLRLLIKKIKELLENKRYFIVIDDIWDSSSWKLINSAFPRNKPGSKVITTTRIHNVALATCNSERKYVYNIKPLSDEDSRRLFFRRTFPGYEFPDTPRKEEISKCIMKTCGGMPLAINSIASLLAGEPDSTWENVWKSLGSLTDGTTEEHTDIYNMKQILDLSYMYLPDDLKTCLLYVCKYPEDREIDKIDLLRQWVAEGFVIRKGLLDAEDVAEQNFKALINMCMIQPGKIDYNNEVLSCRVHDIILDLMRSKSSEVNFVQVIDGLKDVSGPYGEIRRVSVQYNYKEDGRILETIKGSLSHTRSISLYRDSLVPYFLEFKYVRVLYIEHKYDGKGLDLTGISRLFLLRYLKFACPRHSHYGLKLPDLIGHLQQLETLDLDRGYLNNYPSDIVSLPWMSHLICGGRGTVLPDGIERLKSLRTLIGICVYKSSIESINGLGMLTNLRRLQICSNEPKKSEEATSMRMDALHSSICKLSANLRILNLGEQSTVILDVRGWTKSLFPHASNIRELDLVCCNFQRCPQWISLLYGLYKFSIMVTQVADGVIIVAQLPSLAYLCLSTGHKARDETVVVPGSGAFQSLKHLIFSCSKASLRFEAGAMPKLEKLEISFRFHMARRFMPAGIEYLQARTLKKISLSVDWNEMKAKECDEDDGRTYMGSEEYNEELWYHTSSLRRMLKRAFKQHHPRADIAIHFEEGFKDEDYEHIEDDDKMEDDYIDAVEKDGNEEDNDEEDDEVRPFLWVRKGRTNRDYDLYCAELYEL